MAGTTTGGNTNGGMVTKGLLVVASFLALLGGIASVVRPMAEQIDALATQVEALRASISAHVDGHPARVDQKIDSVVEKIDKLDELATQRILRLEEWQLSHEQKVTEANAAQWERIRSLERIQFGWEPKKGSEAIR
jgi:outer membrane murein-binding lipoprotein Lpp